MDQSHDTIVLHQNDNVAVARRTIAQGSPVSSLVHAQTTVPAGHKISLVPIKAGEPVYKYHQIIGFASEDIEAGMHLHTHNMEMRAFDRDYAIGKNAQAIELADDTEKLVFEGYKRASGKTGTRNYIGVLSSVNCSATVCKFVQQAFSRDELAPYPHIDGVIALTHGTGCGMADRGEGFSALQRVLWGYARHPNFAGILMIGLGCEVNQIDFLLEAYGIERGELFQHLIMQETGGTRATIDRACGMIREMLPKANEARRQKVFASELNLALQCGGSDAYSGITANPALGHASDLLVRQGGTAILAETPEIYGAEHLLTQRAASQETGEKLISRIRWWEEYTASNGGEMNNNPSPGNKKGGLTTILEKSLGAVAKGGTTSLNEVLLYAEEARKRGFLFMDSPGYDPVSVTGQVASGCNIVAFTTGRGSCFGFKPSPSIKLATNTSMYERMADDMDLNCGDIITDGVSIEEKGKEILKLLLETASGKKSKSEELGLGDYEFTPWQIGAVM